MNNIDWTSRPHKYARIEEERRFLLAQLPPDLDTEASFIHITDRYFAGTRMRLRRMASVSGETVALKLTQKYRLPDQEARHTTITNIYLDEAEYELFASLPASELSKRRYSYPYGGLQYAIDVFEGRLEGLILAEIEATGERAISAMAVPDFALMEVTGQAFFNGGELVRATGEEMRRRLSALLGG